MMGYEESYVLRTGYFQFAQTFFPKTAVLFSKANGIELEDFGYFQEAGVDWCQKELVPFLHSQYHFETPIIVEEQDIQDNFLQLYSCNKYFICPNSTYCYWVGYLLRLTKPFVTVFVPDFNTLLEQNGKQIADTRDWEVVSVDRTGFE